MEVERVSAESRCFVAFAEGRYDADRLRWVRSRLSVTKAPACWRFSGPDAFVSDGFHRTRPALRHGQQTGRLISLQRLVSFFSFVDLGQDGRERTG